MGTLLFLLLSLGGPSAQGGPRPEYLSYPCSKYLAVVGAFLKDGKAAARKEHLNGEAGPSKSEKELRKELAALKAKPRDKEKADAFFADIAAQQKPGWAKRKKRIYGGDYLPKRRVEGAYPDATAFSYDPFVGQFYVNLPKVKGEENVFYYYGHGKNPEAEYKIVNGEKKAVIIVGGKAVTAKEFAPILTSLGYTKGNIRMITCWAGGSGSKHPTVTPFMDDLLVELGGRAQWIKGTVGALHIEERGNNYTLSSLRNASRDDGHFESTHITTFIEEKNEILRLDGSLDKMRTVCWGGKCQTASTAHSKITNLPKEIKRPLPQSIWGSPNGKGETYYVWGDGRVHIQDSKIEGTYHEDNLEVTFTFPNRKTIRLKRTSNEEELVLPNGERIIQQ